MVKLSTLVILVGVAMFLVPIPPIASAVGGLTVIAVGIALRVVTDL